MTTFEALRIAFKSLGRAVKNAITRPDVEGRLERKARRRLLKNGRPSEHKMLIAAMRAVMPYESTTQRNAAKRRRKERSC